MQPIKINKDWWQQLTPVWKQAFAEACFRHGNEPSLDELVQLSQTTALRFAGPTAPYPNMSVELTDLSGVQVFEELLVLIVTYHQVESIKELAALRSLRGLFLYHNRISSLEGLEHCNELEQLYVQHNQIRDLLPLQRLTGLKELYVHDNLLSSLQGLTEDHADNLEKFYCKPNSELKQKELIKVERELGIRCLGN